MNTHAPPPRRAFCFPHARLLMVLGTREKKMAKAVSKDTRRAGGREGGRAGGRRARATPGAAEDEPQCAHLQLAARTQQTTPLSSRAGNRRRGPEKGRGRAVAAPWAQKGRGRTVAARGAKGQRKTDGACSVGNAPVDLVFASGPLSHLRATVFLL